MKLTLATENEHKVAELRNMLAGMEIEVSSLADLPHIGSIVEDGVSFRENALKKARAVHKAAGGWVLADDSGLQVDALNGEPGIYSSRYAGREKDYPANNQKLLLEMRDVPKGRRQARFVCVMALLSPDGEERVVEGRCEGEIAFELKGSGGFGYDPLFYLPEFGRTMAELPMSEKNKISHRSRALAQARDVLLEFLRHHHYIRDRDT